ncbi:hypothetical protein QUB05_07965 [Microcoleus sp. F10-C6]|uniref:hypothetical protein n=1 Tax=unclassified Microcoleus TaxID=2642155 RepID=UPI002FD0D34B
MKNMALLNTGMNSRFPNGYRQSMVSFVTSSEKVIHTMNQQRQNWQVRRQAPCDRDRQLTGLQ